MPKISADVRTAMDRRRSARLHNKELSPAGRPKAALKGNKSSPTKASKGCARRSVPCRGSTPLANVDKKVDEVSDYGTPRTGPNNSSDDVGEVVDNGNLKDIANADTCPDNNRAEGSQSDTGEVAVNTRKCKLPKCEKDYMKTKKGTGEDHFQTTRTSRKQIGDQTRSRDTASARHLRATEHQARRRSPKAKSLPDTRPQQKNERHPRKVTSHRKRTSSSVPAAEMSSANAEHKPCATELCSASSSGRRRNRRKLVKALFDDDSKDVGLNTNTGDSCKMQCSVLLQADVHAKQEPVCRSVHGDAFCHVTDGVDSKTSSTRSTADIDHTNNLNTLSMEVKMEQPETQRGTEYNDWLGTITEIPSNRNENCLVSNAKNFGVTTLSSCDNHASVSSTSAHPGNFASSTNEQKLGKHQGDTETQEARPATAGWVNVTGDSDSRPARRNTTTTRQQSTTKDKVHAVKSANTMSAMIPDPFTIQHGLQQTFDFAAFQPVSPPARRDMRDEDFPVDVKPGQETHGGRVAGIAAPPPATNAASSDYELTRTPDKKTRATTDSKTSSQQTKLECHSKASSRACHSRLKAELCSGGGGARERKHVAESTSCTNSASKETKQSPKTPRRAVRTKSGRQKHLSAPQSSKQQSLVAAAGRKDRVTADESTDVSTAGDVCSNICDSWLAPLLGLDAFASPPDETTSSHSDVVSRWRYNQMTQWRQQAFNALVNRWDEYLRTPAVEMRKYEMQNARDFDYNTEARSLIEDSDLYVWQLIDQLNADFDPKCIDEFGKL